MSSAVPPSPGNLSWRVARNCNAGNCVQVAATGDVIVIGDTKSPGQALAYSQEEWASFVEGIKQGDFDSLQ